MMIVIMIIITLFYGIDNHYYADIDNNAHWNHSDNDYNSHWMGNSKHKNRLLIVIIIIIKNVFKIGSELIVLYDRHQQYYHRS